MSTTATARQALAATSSSAPCSSVEASVNMSAAGSRKRGGNYAAGFLRGLPRRGASGAQK